MVSLATESERGKNSISSKESFHLSIHVFKYNYPPLLFYHVAKLKPLFWVLPQILTVVLLEIAQPKGKEMETPLGVLPPATPPREI